MQQSHTSTADKHSDEKWTNKNLTKNYTYFSLLGFDSRIDENYISLLTKIDSKYKLTNF